MGNKSHVTINGVQMKIIERLGYQGGHHSIMVESPDGTERVAIKLLNGTYRFWSIADRTGAPNNG